MSIRVIVVMLMGTRAQSHFSCGDDARDISFGVAEDFDSPLGLEPARYTAHCKDNLHNIHHIPDSRYIQSSSPKYSRSETKKSHACDSKLPRKTTALARCSAHSELRYPPLDIWGDRKLDGAADKPTDLVLLRDGGVKFYIEHHITTIFLLENIITTETR